MIGSQPGVALDRLSEALKAEILTAPETEVHAIALEAAPAFRVEALRAFVARAVDRADQMTTLPLRPVPGQRVVPIPSSNR